MSKPSFLGFMQDKQQLDEAFNTAPYELTMGKKGAGDVFFTFIDEDEKEYRIQFYTPQGLGKNVRQVFIGQKRGSTYPDAIARFKNPMRVIASMIEATKQYIATPLGKTIDGYAVNFSKKALERGMSLIPKIIRQSGLKQKLNVMDLTYAPVPDRGYVWLVRKGKDPAQVFDGPKMQGITWDDPDKVGDVPVQNDIPDSNAPTQGWSNTTAAAGNPNLDYRDERGMLLGSIGVRFSPIYGVYSGSSKSVNFKEVESSDAEDLAKKLKLPSIPKNVLDQFINAAKSWWSSNGFRPDVSNSPTHVEWNIAVSAKTNGIYSSAVKVSRDNDVILSSKEISISVRDGAMAKVAKTQSIAQVTVFNKQFVGRGEIDQTTMAADRRGMGWELKSGGKIVAYIEFGVGAAAAQSNPDYEDKGEWKYDNRNRRGKQPQMVYSITKGRSTYSAMLSAHSMEPGTYVLHGSDGKSFRGPSADLIIGQARLPSPPIDMYNQFTRDSKEFWGQIDITEGVVIPRNAKVTIKTKSTFTIKWDVRFPDKSAFAGADVTTTVLRVRENDYIISNVIGTNSKTFNDMKSYDFKGDINKVLADMGERYSLAASQLSTLGSASYNPNDYGMNLLTVGAYGEIKFDGQDLGLPSNRQVVISALASAKSKPASNGKKTGVELATYADSINNNAPKTRDVDWQIYASNNGQSINVDWDITFRRNTREGAFREYKSQIDRANQYIQDVAKDAVSKGYDIGKVRVVTLQDARDSDEWARNNGGEAYSEYEQSLGGGVGISIK